ncbi:unnamed protein product [Rhizoctonia solani]|uniref:Peptidase C14 caspase domain-containing protein n=1 Tax=Rhizoctonia solani TaxID=456999 RepID=A0A8H3B6Q7_9AGAM|nr:unnamed protein product [Rhizoctonia solani]
MDGSTDFIIPSEPPRVSLRGKKTPGNASSKLLSPPHEHQAPALGQEQGSEHPEVLVAPNQSQSEQLSPERHVPELEELGSLTLTQPYHPHGATQPVASLQTALASTQEDTTGLWKALGIAIREGDSMYKNKSKYKARGATVRRALLYEQDTRHEYLSTTPNDVLNIYRMLLNQGYKKEDIRILIARAPGTTQYKCQPLKKYIMKSLEWLVKGARPTDYRYFHFSGHGEVFAVDENTQGKEARAIPKDIDNAEADDTELHTNPDAQAQVMIQKIDEAELRYYNEGTTSRILQAYLHPP